ncbi:MAG: response regulator, partial [Planctomycetota bacterium]|nr:response regulator [Planctomycetota bacterium]
MNKILVVDDSAMDRKLAGGLLEKNEEWEVVYAGNGLEAIELIELHQPDVVVTDLQMPEMDGLKLVQQAKERFPTIPVVLMTARGSEEIAVQALQSGAASYVPKRVLARELAETVMRVLAAVNEERSNAKLLSHMRASTYSFELDNDFSLITSLIGYLQQAFRGLGICGESDRIRVGIALEEALVNAFYHGNLEVSSELREEDHKKYYELARSRAQELPYRDRRTHVDVTLSPDEAVYVIRDEGPGFDPGN